MCYMASRNATTFQWQVCLTKPEPKSFLLPPSFLETDGKFKNGSTEIPLSNDFKSNIPSLKTQIKNIDPSEVASVTPLDYATVANPFQAIDKERLSKLSEKVWLDLKQDHFDEVNGIKVAVFKDAVTEASADYDIMRASLVKALEQDLTQNSRPKAFFEANIDSALIGNLKLTAVSVVKLDVDKIKAATSLTDETKKAIKTFWLLKLG